MASTYLLFLDSATCLFVHQQLALDPVPVIFLPLSISIIIRGNSGSDMLVLITRQFMEKQEYSQLQIDSMLKLFSNEEETSVFQRRLAVSFPFPFPPPPPLPHLSLLLPVSLLLLDCLFVHPPLGSSVATTVVYLAACLGCFLVPRPKESAI